MMLRTDEQEREGEAAAVLEVGVDDLRIEGEER